MNPCQRYQNLIFNLIDGDLDNLRKKELKKHLQECSHCDHFVKQLSALKIELSSLTQQKASEEFQIILRDRIRREFSGKKKPFITFPSFPFQRRWIPAAGLAIGMACIILFVVNRKDDLFQSQDSRLKASISESSSENNSPDRIQYVIDEFPGAVTVSRTDERPESISDTIQDSVFIERNRSPMRVRLTPVNF